MKFIKSLLVTTVSLLLAGSALAKEPTPETLPAGQNMYVIEREIPGAGKLTAEELKGISQTSCSVLKEMGPAKIQWLHSYVTGDKIYCVYIATSEEAVREHAKKGGFPANAVNKVSTIIGPQTAK